MASGEQKAFRKAKRVLDAIAVKVYRLGDSPGMGSKVTSRYDPGVASALAAGGVPTVVRGTIGSADAVNPLATTTTGHSLPLDPCQVVIVTASASGEISPSGAGSAPAALSEQARRLPEP